MEPSEGAGKSSSWTNVTAQGIEVSPQDDRAHKFFTLENGIQIVVSSDPGCEKAAAALAVKVGASSDPLDLPGVAHFCEHMCFLGSLKYPEENAYKKFLSAHAGRSNASTSSERTIFHFDVASEHFQHALDLFAQFFVAPLFSESATDRELNAVDSEDSKNRCNDGRRLLQVSRALAAPGHPYGKFSTGNLKTLKTEAPPHLDARQAVLAFHGRHYTAPRMRLAICGRESLQELEVLATELFSSVPSDPRPAADPEGPNSLAVANGAIGLVAPIDEKLGTAFAPPYAELPMLVEVAPLRELRELQLSWQIPAMRPLYRACPSSLFGHLLGHEGEGSIFAELQDRGWATALSAGSGHEDENFSLFKVSIVLTPEGEQHWHEAVALVFQYCNLLRGMTPDEVRQHWSERSRLSAIAFQFQQKSQPYEFVQMTAGSLCHHDARHVFSAGRVVDDMDPAMVSHLVERLTLENIMVRFLSPNLRDTVFTAEDRWYQVPFSKRTLPIELRNSCAGAGCSRLRLPLSNEYIPDDLTLVGTTEAKLESPVSPPLLISEDDWGRLWYKIDERYAQPRVELYLMLRSTVVRESLAEAHVFTSYMSSRLKQSTYDASLAGLHWSCSHGTYGLLICISGYSQRAPHLLSRILSTVLAGPWAGEEPEAQALRFETVRERIERAHKNWDLERPDAHACHWANILLEPAARTVAEKLEQIQRVSLEDVKAFHAKLLSRFFVECFVNGNATADRALEMYGATLETLQAAGASPLPEAEFPFLPRAELLEGDFFELHGPVPNTKEENSAAWVYLEAGVLTPPQQAALRMITQVMREPCFNELRTQQQIGYIVSSSIQVDYAGKRKIEGLDITVVSKQLSADEVLARIDAFLVSFRSTLAGLSDEEWGANAESLSTKMLLPPKKLGEEGSRHWPLIRRRVLTWRWREEIVEALAAIGRDDALALYDSMLAAASRRRISSLIFGCRRSLPDVSAPGEEFAQQAPKMVPLFGDAFTELRASLPRYECDG